MSRTLLALTIAVAVLPAAVSTARAAEATGRPGPAEAVARQAEEPMSPAESNNAFALDLYAELRAQEGNVFCSPFSIWTALAMTYAGARGETAEQMAHALRFALPPEELHPAIGELIQDLNARQERGNYQLSVANALWGQKGFEFHEQFLRLTRRHYGAGLEEVDFKADVEAARLRINEWVEQKTQGKIQDLIPRGVLTALTRLVLTNAIYFRARWASVFDERATREEDFTLLEGEKVRVPMMRQTGRFGYAEHPGLKVLELPYVRHELSMVILLPTAPDGLPELEQDLDAEHVDRWLGQVRSERVNVAMPRFTMTSRFRLDKVLQELGMSAAFRPVEADFTGIAHREDLHIQAVLHQAFVDVNEEGTEAAAATAVAVAATSAPMGRPKEFRADHPFLFLIRDRRSGCILFIGRLMDPRA